MMLIHTVCSNHVASWIDNPEFLKSENCDHMIKLHYESVTYQVFVRARNLLVRLNFCLLSHPLSREYCLSIQHARGAVPTTVMIR